VSDAAQSDLSTAEGDGSIVLRSSTGSIVLNDGTATNVTAVSAHGAGNVLIQTLSATGGITSNADIISTSGNISVLGGRDVTFALDADIRSQGANSTGSIDVVAANGGSVVMSANSVFGSSNGSVRVQAANGIQVGVISTAASASANDGSGMVSLTAGTGAIVDAQNLGNTSNDAVVNITASGLRLNAGTAVGESVNHLETTVLTLSASATGAGIYLLESDGVTVDNVGLTVNRVKTDGSVTGSTVIDAAQSDLVSGANGSIVLRSTAGNIVLNNGTASNPSDDTAVSAHGTGNVLIQTLAADGDITANADLVSGSGSISVLAGRSAAFSAGADIRTTSSTGVGSGSIDIEAGSGSITQSATSVFLSTGAAATARLLAAQSVTVGDIDLTLGKVSITATAGSILDADVVTTTNDTDQDITANALHLKAGTAIGGSVNALETSVNRLALDSGAGGAYLVESDGLLVDAVSVSLFQVGASGATSSQSAGGQDLSVTGTLALRVLVGNLAAASSERLVSATDLLLQVDAGGTASAASPLRFTASQLAAEFAQDAFLVATGATTLGSVQGVNGIQAGAKLLLSVGTLNGGSLQVQQAVSSLDRLRFDVAGALALGADVTSGGHLSLLSVGNLTSGAGHDLIAAGDVYLRASAVAVDLAGLVRSTSGQLLVQAGTDVSVFGVEALLGHVALIAQNGQVNGKDGLVDVRAEALSVSASDGIGAVGAPLLISVLDGSFHAGAGGVHVVHSDAIPGAGLNITSFQNVPFSLLKADGVVETVLRSQAGITTTTTAGGGDLNLSVASNLTVGAAISVAGEALLNAGDTLVVIANTGIIAAKRIALEADLISIVGSVQSTGDRVSAQAQSLLQIGANGRVSSGPSASLALAVSNGSLSLLAGGVLQAGSVGLSASASVVSLMGSVSSTGTVDVLAGGALSMVSGGISRVEGAITAGGDVRIEAGTDIGLGAIHAAEHNVALIAGGSILDGDNALDITARGLYLKTGSAGGVGSGADALETAVDRLALSAGSGGAYVSESNGLVVDTVAVSVARLALNGTSITQSAGGEDLVVANGALMLQVQTGDLVVNAGENGGLGASLSGATAGAGRLLLQSVTGALTLNAGVSSSHGPIGLQAQTDLRLAAGGNIGGGGTVDLLARNGAVQMASGEGEQRGERSITAGGDVRIEAGTDIGLGAIHAAEHNVALIAGGSILDGDNALDITARGLYLKTGSAGGVGSGADALETAVDRLALSAGSGGAYVSESNGLVVDTVAVSVARLALNGTSITQSAGGEDLVVANGALMLQVQTGDLVVNAGENGGLGASLSGATAGAGRLLLQSVTGALTLNAGVSSSHGPIGLQAQTDLRLAAGGNIGGGGTVDLLARNGAVQMASGEGEQRGERSITAGGDVRIEAGTDIGLGLISAAGHNVALIAGGSILDGDSALDITARGLYLKTGAAGGVGSNTDALETAVDRLALSAGSGGAYVSESNGLVVDTVAVSVTRLAINGTSSAQSAGGEDLVVAGGTLVLRVLSGDLTVNAGANAEAGVRATGSGQVLLDSAVGALTLNAAVTSDTGAIGLQAQTDLRLAAGGNIGGGGTVDLLARNGAVQMASGEGAQRGERSITAAGDVSIEAGTDIGLGAIHAADHNVALIAGGSILDGDSAVDITARGLYLKTGAAGGVGSPGDALELRLDENLGSLSAEVGSAGVNLQQDGTLRVTEVLSTGAVTLKAAVDLLLGRLNADGQAVQLNALGAVLANNAVDANRDGTRLVASGLVVNAAGGLGTSVAPVAAAVETLSADAGLGGVYFQALGDVRVLSVSGVGPLEVSAPEGTFKATDLQTFNSELTVRSAKVEVDAPLTGQQIDLQPPTAPVGGTPLALVIGTSVNAATPSKAVFLDKTEVANLRFASIVLGSSQLGQEIWLQTALDDLNDKLVFSGNLTLNAENGSVYFAGLIEGVGLTLNGRGSTAYFQGVDMRQSQNATINDALDVSASSILEVADTDPNTRLVLTINGNITVRAGQTLQLLADEIRFGPFGSNGQQVKIVLEAGATLVLGSNSIIVDDLVTFDSDGGHLVLRGAPSANPVASGGPMQIDFAPGALEFDAAATDALVAWLAADVDNDAGLVSLTLGDATTTTRVASPSIWNGLTVGSVLLRGDVVHLGEADGSAWTLQRDAVMRATSGDLRLHVDLLAQGDLSLVANTGSIAMVAGIKIAGTKIAGNGAVALTAATGIAVGQIDADQRIDLFSPAGQVRAVAALGGQAHLQAPAVSFYGYGLALPLQSSQAVLVVDAQALQVAAETGRAARGYAADGSLYYRLMDKGVVYHQLQVFDQAPQRVMVPRSEVLAQADQVAQSQPLAIVWDSNKGLSGWLQTLEPTISSTSAVARYLQAASPDSSEMQPFGMAFDGFNGDEMDYIDYGLINSLDHSEFLLNSSSDLLRSTGQLLAASQWSIDSQIL
jgi:hypothetical protein